MSNIKLELGRLTIITGASNSGKSALLRSLAALASNVRGTSYITRGQKQASITLTSERWKVTLERGESHGVYRIMDLETGKEELFTKLGGSVPDRVTEVLRLDPIVSGKSINFAVQRDVGRPYLLDDSGSEVARELGELTNVSKIFEAVRESNRLRMGVNSELKTRESDLADCYTRLEDFKGLSSRLESLSESEQLVDRAQDLSSQLARLSSLVQDVVIAQSVLDRSTLPEVPDISRVSKLQGQLSEFQGVVRHWLIGQRNLITVEAALEEAMAEEQTAKDDMHSALVAAGKCPTCGSLIYA